MNPAALRSELDRVEPGGKLIVNTDTFNERNLKKAGYDSNPLTDDSLRAFRVYEVPMTSLTKEAAPTRRQAPRRRALQELLRPRAHLRGCTPGPSTGAGVDRPALRRERAGQQANPTAFQAGLRTSVRPPSCSTTSTR